MIYIFDKKQAIIKVLTNDDFTAAHLNFKINTATTFEFSLPASKALPSGSKYVATPHPLNDSKFIMLRLTERVDNTETIDYSAYELAYQELATDGYIEDKRPQNQSALNLMKIALDGSNWELNNVNVSGTAATNFYYVDRLSAISKVVDLLGGEIVFYIEIQGNAISGRYMDYLARQGADTSKVFASGSNLLTVERQSDSSNIYTAILPRGKGEEIDNGEADTPDGYGRRINIADVEWKKSAGKPLDKPKGSIVLSDPDATAEWGQINGNARLLLQTYDDIDDVNVLINSAYKTLQSVNHPQIQYSATVADVGGLSLGDTVLIMHSDRDLSYKTRVFEVKYNLLSPDQTELSLGDNLSSNSITSQINSLNTVADTASSQTQWTINQIGRPGTTYGATAPDSPKVGDIWFKYLPDGGTEIYRWNGDIWELLASPTTADDIADAVTDAVTQANSHTATAIEQNNASQQEMMNDIAKSQADLAIKDGDFINKAQAMADKALSDAKANIATVASKSLGTYLVRLLPGTNIFKTTNSTTIQAQVWKAGQDITSTLDNASFSWKLAKDGANAIGLTNNVKNITAKPSDFTNTGTYIVNVIIPVTDTTGTTRNQTFSDSTTIAKVADGVNGDAGNGISSTTITYATSASGTNAPTSGYTSTIPTVNKGQFLWQRTVISYTNGTTKNSDVVTYFAKDGLNGLAGMDGGQGMIAQPSKPTSGLVDGFLWLDTSQTYPVYYVYDSSIKDFKIYQFNAKNINADQIKAKFVGTDRLSASEIIADDLHVKSANIDGKMTASQITVSSTNGVQTSLANFNLGEMSQTISDTKNVVNSLGQVNQLMNTEFTPDMQGWKLTADSDRNAPYKSGFDKNAQANMVGFNTANASSNTYATLQQDVLMGQAGGGYISLSWQSWAPTFANYANLWVRFYDNNNTKLDEQVKQWTPQKSDGSVVGGLWTRQKFEGIAIPSGSVKISVFFQAREGINAYLVRPMLVFHETVGDYVAGNYNNNAALAQVKVTADGVSSIVSNPTTGLSTRVQTAEGTLNTVKSTADGAMSKANQTANDITQEISDRGTGDTNTLQSSKDFTQSTITNYNSGLQSQLTQTSSAFLATISSTNLIVDSSLLDSAATNTIVNWIPSGTSKWYYSPGVSYQGVQSMGYNQTANDANYSFVDSQPWSNNSFSGTTLNVSIDIRASTMGGSSTDYLIVYLRELDVNGNLIAQTSITNTISTSNNSWVNYRKKITVDPNSKGFFIRYQMRGNGNVYVARPYVGVQELIAGGYTAGSNNNNQTILSLFKDNWSIGIADNISNITSGIVGNSSSMSLISKNIVLDGNTTVTGDFYAKGGNFKNLNASNLTVGTLNGSQVNITNINASNIVSGAISGANLNINLNTGSVVFQKGRINSSDYTTDINIDQGYISTANGDTRAILSRGKLQLIDPTLFNPQTNPYLEISNKSGFFNGMSALIKARDSLTVSINGYDERAYDTPLSTEGFVGLSIGKYSGKYSDKLMATKIGGAEQGVIISGGKQFTIEGYGGTPYIYVGSDSSGSSPNGDRVSIHASYFHSPSTYLRTTSGSANVVVSSDGALVRSSSARKYKLDIKNNIPIADSLKLTQVPLSTWVDKHEHEENGSNERYFGMIAEDLRDAGLEYLVQHGEDNEVEGINYDRVALLLIPLVKELKERIEELESKGK
ncbi:phage tail spike protein [Leuconostoc sp. C2]|uniref:phage tail spike protein n=1 Tax=Leuconostoc sp. (strain C2) TaxID=979982 RepID=UPI0002175BB3|nr:phage tail spike protein [Leuconostoc sp. C2]AEJ31420.1 phage endopeptidase [Leuconostoc sp. C2]